MVAIRLDDEREEVAEVASADRLELAEERVARPAKADVDVAGASGPLEAELEDDAALHDGAIAEMLEHAREEAVEHEHLAEARHMPGAPAAVRMRRSTACLKASGLAYVCGGISLLVGLG